MEPSHKHLLYVNYIWNGPNITQKQSLAWNTLVLDLRLIHSWICGWTISRFVAKRKCRHGQSSRSRRSNLSPLCPPITGRKSPDSLEEPDLTMDGQGRLKRGEWNNKSGHLTVLPYLYLSFALVKRILRHVRKVTSHISLCSPPSLSEGGHFPFLWNFVEFFV